MSRFNLKLNFVFFTFILFFFSCSNFSSFENVSFTLDKSSNLIRNCRAERAEVFEVQQYKVMTIDKNFNFYQNVFPSGKELSFEVTKLSCIPFLIQALDEEGNEKGKPLGFIYPLSSKMSIYGGFCAEIFISLIKGGLFYEKETKIRPFALYLSNFNWEKFEEAISVLENPWVYDRSLILEGIGERKFSKDCLVLKKDEDE